MSKNRSHNTPEEVTIINPGVEYVQPPKVDNSKIKHVTVGGTCECGLRFVALLTRADIKAINKALKDTVPSRGRAAIADIKPTIKIYDPKKVKDAALKDIKEASKK